MTDAAELAEKLETIVRSVPGVTVLYPTTPIVVTIVGSVVDALTQRAKAPKLVTVTTENAKLSVTARIGVAHAASPTEVCRRVHDTIAANPAALAFAPINTISVTVVSIG